MSMYSTPRSLDMHPFDSGLHSQHTQSEQNTSRAKIVAAIDRQEKLIENSLQQYMYPSEQDHTPPKPRSNSNIRIGHCIRIASNKLPSDFMFSARPSRENSTVLRRGSLRYAPDSKMLQDPVNLSQRDISPAKIDPQFVSQRVLSNSHDHLPDRTSYFGFLDHPIDLKPELEQQMGTNYGHGKVQKSTRPSPERKYYSRAQYRTNLVNNPGLLSYNNSGVNPLANTTAATSRKKDNSIMMNSTNNKNSPAQYQSFDEKDQKSSRPFKTRRSKSKDKDHSRLERLSCEINGQLTENIKVMAQFNQEIQNLRQIIKTPQCEEIVRSEKSRRLSMMQKDGKISNFTFFREKSSASSVQDREPQQQHKEVQLPRLKLNR